MLIENTLFGEVDRVKLAIETLKTYEPEDGYYVAYSGGKDSTVILDLIRRSGVRYDAHYNVTTVDPPELVRFIRTQPDVRCHRPEISMWDLIVKEGVPPTRIARYCCRELKERGGAGRRVITGVRARESVKRSKRRQIESCYKDSAKTFIHIVFDWSETDVWEYIKDNNLPYCSLYNEEFKRLGCICCPQKGGKEMQRDANRWPKYKALYMRSFRRMIDKREQDGKPLRQFTTAEAVWDWWVSEKPEPEHEGQTFIFD